MTRTHQLRTIALGDDPRAWAALGFALTGPEPTGTEDTAAADTGAGGTGADQPRGSAAVGLGNTTLTLSGTAGGFLGWSVDGITKALDGLAVLDVEQPEQTLSPETSSPEAASPEPHSNGITSIDHVVINTGDIARTAGALTDAGMQCRGGRSTTSYGSPMRQQFYWLGDVILELVGPDEGEPTTDPPASVFGLALATDDLDATVARLGDLAGSPKEAVQPGRRIAGIRGDRVGVSLPLAVMSPHPG